MNSRWCKNELIYAVKRNKKFFPVQITEIINPYNKLKEINVVLERHQIIKLFPEYEKKITKAINDVSIFVVLAIPRFSFSFFA